MKIEPEDHVIVVLPTYKTESSTTTPPKSGRRTKIVDYKEIPPEPMNDDELTAVNYIKMYYQSSQHERDGKRDLAFKKKTEEDSCSQEDDKDKGMLCTESKADSATKSSKKVLLAAESIQLAKTDESTKNVKKKRISSPKIDSGDSWVGATRIWIFVHANSFYRTSLTRKS